MRFCFLKRLKIIRINQEIGVYFCNDSLSTLNSDHNGQLAIYRENQALQQLSFCTCFFSHKVFLASLSNQLTPTHHLKVILTVTFC